MTEAGRQFLPSGRNGGLLDGPVFFDGLPVARPRPSLCLDSRSLRLSIALVEICVGVGMAACSGWFNVGEALALNTEWVRFLASTGAVVLTFLAGAELDPDVVRVKLAEVTVVGMVGFLAPFLGCTAIAFYELGWDWQASAFVAWPCRRHRWPWSMR